MLGRLAKGVGGLAKGVAGVALGEARAALTAVANDEAEVEALLQRISGSLLPEYRRQAMSQLKDLLVDNPKAQLALGHHGLPVLLAILRDERDDLELLRGALEALLAATAGPAGGGAAPGAGGHGQEPHGGQGEAHAHQHGMSAAEAQAAALNAELLAREREWVVLLLGLLEDEPVGVPDFYVRYHTVQLLTCLLQHCAGRLQEAVLATPMSVVRLTELLGERSEVIRNEALLLLAALTRPTGAPGAGGGGGSSEVQKIAAFEGAFDRIAELLREEGGLEGGMVVQDCIELMNNLLRGNMANQRLFREMGHAANLPRLLAAAVPAAAPSGAAATAAGSGATSSRAGGVVGQFAQALGPIPFLGGGGGGGAGAAFDVGGGGGADGGAAGGSDEPSLELHNALAALAAAGSDALLGPPSLPPQKTANLLALMETLRLLCAPPTATSDPDLAAQLSNRTANQSKLLAAGALEALVAAALQAGGLPSAPVRAAALGALGDLIDCQPPAVERLAGATVRPAEPDGDGGLPSPPPAAEVPALTAVLRVALYGANATERAAAGHVLACYCRGNTDGQAALVAALGPSAAAPVPPPAIGSFGQDLVAALLAGGSSPPGAQGPQAAVGSRGSSGPVLCVRAIGVLQYLLCGNAVAKQRLLAVPLEGQGPPGSQPDFLLPRLVRQLTAALRTPCTDPALARLLVCSLLRLLLLWLHDCPSAVAGLLGGAAHVPLLVDLATGRQGPPDSAAAASGAATASASGGGAASGDGGDPVVCGLAACVLGACIMYGRSPPPQAAVPAPAAQSPSDLVLDAVMSRIGLAHFLYRLDDLRRSPAFAADGAAAAAAAAGSARPVTARGGVAAADAVPAPAAASHSAEGAVTGGGEVFTLGRDAVGIINGLAEAVRQRTMEAFCRPPGHRGQDAVPTSPAEVPGADDASRLAWALATLGRTARELEELRARNRALAEDLFRLSQSQGASGVPPPAAGAAAATAGAGPAGAPGLGGSAAAAFPGAPPTSAAMGPVAGGVAGSASDVEARVALELRAGRAEAEVAALRQQLELLSARLSQAEADAAAARESAATATLAASKAEADLADLSGAYNNLEAHAFATEAQLRAAQAAAAQAQAQVAAAEARAAQAVAGNAHGAPSASEADIQRRIDSAVAHARTEVEAEANEGMTDLLVCLGQEERKVQLLSEALAQHGVDVDALLASIAQEVEAEEDGDGGLR